MPTALSSDQIRELATHGARARLAELRDEMAALIRAFPAIGEATHSATPGPSASRGKKRSRLSAAGRRRIAEAQRRRWAAAKQKS